MKTTLAIAAIALVLIYVIGRFALSDLFYPDYTILAEKPWRPAARLAFGVVTIPILVVFVGWVTKTIFRNQREP